MKIKLNFVFVISMLTIFISSFVYASSNIKGDINSDGKVDLVDVFLTYNHYLKNGSLTADKKAISDINSDGKVDLLDVFLVYNVYLKSQDVLATSISINPNVKTLEVGESFSLNATILPANTTNKTITWESSNNKVATVNSNGVITGINSGNCTIFAKTQNGKTAQCLVTVNTDKAPEITVSSSDDSVILAGSEVTYTIKVADSNLKSVDKSKLTFSDSGDGYDDKTVNYITTQISDFDYTTNTMSVTVKTKDDTDACGHLTLNIEEGFAVDSNGNKNSKFTRNDYVASLNSSTAEGLISAVVGVGNSFYIKNYDFYIDDQVKEKDRTTNEYTFSGLSTGTSYKITVNVEFYTGKSNDNTLNGYIEKYVRVFPTSGAEIYFIDVSEDPKATNSKSAADAIFIKTATGKTILIDSGYSANNSDLNTKNGGTVITNFLKNELKFNGNKIDYFILTHYDSDHIGGFSTLIKNYSFDNIVVGCVSETYSSISTPLKTVLDYGKSKNLITVTAGNCIKIDGCMLNIFNPYPHSDIPDKFYDSIYTESGTKSATGYRQGAFNYKNSSSSLLQVGSAPYYQTTHTKQNNQSVIVKLICGSRKMLFMGDAEFFTEEILLGKVRDEINLANNSVEFTKPSGTTSEGTTGKYGYLSDSTGLPVRFSSGYNKGNSPDANIVTTNLNLVKDIMVSEGLKTTSQVESKYHLSRLTKKDITAQVLKKGHHGVKNTTSEQFLFAVSPNKIISTGSAKYGSSLISYLDYGVDFRVRKYYENTASGAESSVKDSLKLVKSNKVGNQKYGLQNNLHTINSQSYYKANWFYSVYGPSEHKFTDDEISSSSKMTSNPYKSYIKISTTNGLAWIGYSDISNYIHDMQYYYTDKCSTKKATN